MAGGGNKRRLSRGGSAGPLLGKTYDSEEDSDADLMDEEEDEPAPRGRSVSGSANGRRRSSFGGARFENAEEQERVVGMYTNIIKLSSENKINDKNSWNLDLIDNMGKLIKNDSREHRGVNFQKASCTLDASIKIYSHRVDDTYSTSHRVLESFSRNKLDEEQEEENEEDEDGVAKPKKGSRVGSRKRSGAANTIEKNIDNINAKEIENEAKIDPIFQTMSKLFDKGGVHGMLMYNLRCTANAPGMALCTEGLPNPLESASVADATAGGAGSAGAGGMLAPLLDTEQLTLAQARAHIMGDAPPVPVPAPASAMEVAAESMTPFAEGEGEGEGKSTTMAGSGQLEQEHGESTVAEAPERLADLVDITAWTAEIALGAPELAVLSVCPQFDIWREVCAVESSAVGVLDPADFDCTAGSTGTDADADASSDSAAGAAAMDEEDEDQKIETEAGAAGVMSDNAPALQAARAKSAMKPGFYDHSCLPFQAWAAPVREAARRRRDTALLSATSSSSAMHTVWSGVGTGTGPSPEESSAAVGVGVGVDGANGVLGFAPETQEMAADDVHDDAPAPGESVPHDGSSLDHVHGDVGHDDDGDDDDDAGYLGMGFMDEEADDCDDDGNYIASNRRASMQAPPPPGTGTGTGAGAGAAGEALAGGATVRLSLSPVKPAPKIQWSAVNGDMQISEDQVVANLEEDEGRVEGMIDGLAAHAGAVASGGVAATAAEYTFFDVEAVSKNNGWAGARHWRWGTARATRATAAAAAAAASAASEAGASADADAGAEKNGEVEGGQDEEAPTTVGASKKSKKASGTATAGGLDFSACLDRAQWAPESSFAAPKRADTTCMTAAALAKAAEEAGEGALFLPKDDKVEARDLCRLLSVPKVVVPPLQLRDLVIPPSLHAADGNTNARKGRFARPPGRQTAAQCHDIVWGLASAGTGGIVDVDGEGAAGTSALDLDLGCDGPLNDDGDDGDDDEIDYDDDRYFAPGGTEDAPEAAHVKAAIRESLGSAHEGEGEMEGGDGSASSAGAALNEKRSVFDIDQRKLIQLDRKVEKIQIGYSVIPKKVNVKQLKVDIWDQVATLAGVQREGGDANKNKNKKARYGNEEGPGGVGTGEEGDDENEEPPPQDFHATQSSKHLQKTTDTSMSFQRLVNTVASSQKQKEVTLSFYFICLLHLANEKTLRITDDKEALDELTISSDATTV